MAAALIHVRHTVHQAVHNRLVDPADHTGPVHTGRETAECHVAGRRAAGFARLGTGCVRMAVVGIGSVRERRWVEAGIDLVCAGRWVEAGTVLEHARLMGVVDTGRLKVVVGIDLEYALLTMWVDTARECGFGQPEGCRVRESMAIDTHYYVGRIAHGRLVDAGRIGRVHLVGAGCIGLGLHIEGSGHILLFVVVE